MDSEHQQQISECAKRLCAARERLDRIESEYFSGAASLAQLRQAWKQRDEAANSLALAHWQASAATMNGDRVGY